MQRILMIGAGAMGGLFAGRLAEAGHRVCVCDTQAARLAAIAAQGIALTDDGGSRSVAVATVDDPAQHGPADLVVVFTKSAATRAAIRAALPAITAETAVLTLQNGLGNPEIIAECVAPGQIAYGVTDVPADWHAPNRVTSHGSATIQLWGFDGTASAAARRACAALQSAGFAATLDPDTRTRVWEKLAFNAALNPLAALLDAPVGALAHPDARVLALDLVSEIIALATHEGVALDPDRIADRIEHALAHHQAHLPSMLQDLRARRATEIAALNGAVAERAANAGLAAPLNTAIVRLIRAAEAAREDARSGA